MSRGCCDSCYDCPCCFLSDCCNLCLCVVVVLVTPVSLPSMAICVCCGLMSVHCPFVCQCHSVSVSCGYVGSVFCVWSQLAILPSCVSIMYLLLLSCLSIYHVQLHQTLLILAVPQNWPNSSLGRRGKRPTAQSGGGSDGPNRQHRESRTSHG